MKLFQIMTTLGLVAGLSQRLMPAVTPATEQAPPPGRVTFSGHIAQIVHQRCAGCHHQGQSAPFNLLTYDDVRKRARQLLEVVESGVMPPWLPEHGYGSFSNERRLTPEELRLIRQWVADGAPEGDPRKAPPIPQWQSGWLEGTPDLTATMETPYTLGAEGADVYRNFVIHIPSDRDRLVRAIEFVPGNPRIVHHAFIRVDQEGQARKLDGLDGEPGFTNMYSWARMPDGQFLTWNPGSRPAVSRPGLAWRLPRNSDLVVEMHLNRTGKPESIQSSVGIYFTEEQPTNSCYSFKLGSYALSFPAGATNEVVRDSLLLPVDIDVLAVYPHAHFLAREMKGYATLPDGTREWLIWIKQWDFNWQGDYRYTTPVRLPKGSTVHLEYFYDNSTNNPANPNYPPKRVVYGEQSSDEMCELGLQILTHQTNDLKTLQQTAARHHAEQLEESLRQRIAFNPDDADALTKLGMTVWAQRRYSEAGNLFDRALQARPDLAAPHHYKGVFLRLQGQHNEARLEFEAALRLDPRFPKAHQQLAFALAALGRTEAAERSFEKALEIDPADPVARKGLTQLRQILESRRRSN